MPERNFPFSERSGQSVPDPFPPVCPQQTGQNSVFLREMSRVAGTIHRQAVVDRCLSQRLHPQSNRKRHRFKRRRAKAGRLRDRARSVGRANGHVAGLFQMARDSGIWGVAVKECSILERTALVRSLKPYASNLDKRLTKSSKRYFIQNCGKNWKIHLGRTREGEEIGFLIVTDSGDTIALDARMNLCRRHRRPRLPESFKRLFPHVSQIVLVTFGRTSNPTVPRMPGGPCRRTARFSGRTDRDRRTSSREEVKRDVWACGFFLGLTRGRCFIPISSGNKKCGIARDSAGERKVLSGLIGEGGLLVREIFVLSSSNG